MNEYRSRLFQAAEYEGWSHSETDSGWVEFTKNSPAGEDVCVFIEGKDIACEVRKYADNFDPDDHAASFIVAKYQGSNGIPGVRELIDDADSIQEMLNDLAAALEAVEVTPEEDTPENQTVCPVCGCPTRKHIQIDETGYAFWTCEKCGVFHFDSSWYKMIGHDTYVYYTDTCFPDGKYVYDTGIEVIGVCSDSGHEKIEEFPSMAECLEWLYQN